MAIDIDDISRRNQHTATPAQATFIYGFPIFAATDISIYQTLAGQDADDLADKLEYLVDYTLTGIGVQTGGTFILVNPAAEGDTLTAAGNTMSLSRTSKFSTNASIASETLDEEFNNSLLMIQQVNTRIDELQTQYQYSEIVDSIIDRKLPALGAGQGWVMNDERTKIEAVDIESGGGSADLLRAELADQTAGIDGTRLVGYNHLSYGGLTTHDILDIIIYDIKTGLSLVDIQRGEYNAVTITGPNIYTGSLTPTPLAYNEGMTIHATVLHTNNQLSTLNLNGLGARSIKSLDGNELIYGELRATNVYQLIYTSDNEWRMMGAPPSSTEEAGLAEVATLPEVYLGIDIVRTITPYTLGVVIDNLAPSGSDVLYATNGYRKFDGGLIMQWGKAHISALTTETVYYITSQEFVFNIQLSSEVGTGLFPQIFLKSYDNEAFKVYMNGTGTLNYHWVSIGKVYDD